MIKIQNIYYMLAYAYQILTEQGYEKCGTEDFINTADLFSMILCKGISMQLKRGLGREYIQVSDVQSCPRGKIDLTESIKRQTMIKQQLMCTYDDFSVDSYFNRILKTTVILMLKSDIPKERKKELRRLMLYFSEVGTLNPYSINWNQHYNRNNQTYQMLINVCYLAIKGLLQTDSKGNYKLKKYLDEQRMCRLYEKFILEYYKKEYPELKVTASQIAWNLDDGIDVMLPVMQSDIMLEFNNKVLIIDAKYYSNTLQKQYETFKLHSDNLYQIFTYVKNKDKDRNGNVAGMLLYAKTDEQVYPDNAYQMSGNRISVKTLNLDLEFKFISEQLDKIVVEHFDICH